MTTSTATKAIRFRQRVEVALRTVYERLPAEHQLLLRMAMMRGDEIRIVPRLLGDEGRTVYGRCGPDATLEFAREPAARLPDRPASR